MALCWLPCVQAEQFVHQQSGALEVFRYEWINFDRTPQALEIALPSAFVSGLVDDPKMRVKQDEVAALIYQRVSQAAARLSDEGYVLTVKQEAAGLNVHGKGVDATELQRRLALLRDTQSSVVEQLRTESYLWVSEKDGISFNYNQMVIDYLPTIKSLVDQWPEHSGIFRERLNSYLSFLQTIPYDPLQRKTDFGVLTPPALLTQNRGDCETKQVALATFIRSTHPDLKLILVGSGDHMILGAGIAPEPGDALFQYEGVGYVLMDATGPGREPVGALDGESRGRLNHGVAEVFPIQSAGSNYL
jgi:hypothetical protein